MTRKTTQKVGMLLLLTSPMLITSGEIASATSVDKGDIYQQVEKTEGQGIQNRQVVSMTDTVRKVIPNYVRYIHQLHPDAVIDIRSLELVNVKENYVDVNTPVRTKLVQKGPERLVQVLEHDAYNTHPEGMLNVSHSFEHGIENTSTFARSVTHNHTAGVNFSYTAKIGLPNNGSELTTEVSYAYSNSNQSTVENSKTVSGKITSTASGILPPMTSGKLLSKVYTSANVYELTSRSYFTGDVTFSYKLPNQATIYTKTVSLYDVFVRADDSIARDDHMWAMTYFDDPTKPEGVQALLFEGKSFVTIEENYRTETSLEQMKKMEF